MREKDVQKAFVKYLINESFTSVQETTSNAQYDILAVKDNCNWYFEIKGSPISAKTKKQQMVKYFQYAIGKIVSIMEEKSKYAIVFPSESYYVNKIDRLDKDSIKRIGIMFYIVEKTGKVWRKL